MPNLNLNLDSFLKHANLASASDTMVMREDGKASVRGRIRSAFTEIEQYRETTRQFIDQYCMRYGSEYRGMAETFFRENLDAESNKPLSARTVKAFLSAAAAKEAQTAARWERWAALEASNPGFAAQKEAVAEKLFAGTQLNSEKLQESPALLEVTQEVLSTLAQLPQKEVAGHDLFLFAKGVLKDDTLSAEQMAKRLNVLLAMIDPASASKTMFASMSDPMEATFVGVDCLFAKLDDPRVSGGSGAQLLDSVLRVVESDLTGKKLHLAKREPTFESNQARFEAFMETLIEKIEDAATDLILQVPGVTTLGSLSRLRDALKNGRLDAILGGTRFAVGVNLQMTQLRMTNLQDTIKWIALYCASKPFDFGHLTSFDYGLPGLTKVCTGVDRSAMRSANAAWYNVKLTGKDLKFPKTFGDCAPYMGGSVKVKDANGKWMDASIMDPRVSNEKALQYGKEECSKDVLRTAPPNQSKLLAATNAGRRAMGYSFILQDGKEKMLIHPFVEETGHLERYLEQKKIKWNTLTEEQRVDIKGKLERSVEESITKRVATWVLNLAQNEKQAAIALTMLGQAQDHYRPLLDQMGTFCDKGVRVDEEGNLHVFRQTREGNPVKFYMDMIVSPEGQVRMDTETFVLEGNVEP